MGPLRLVLRVIPQSSSFDVPNGPAGRYASAGDEDVDSAKVGDRCCDGFLHMRKITGVPCDGEAAHLRGDCFQGFRTPPRHHDVGPFGREESGCGRTDARAPAGDECHLVVKPHVNSSWYRLNDLAASDITHASKDTLYMALHLRVIDLTRPLDETSSLWPGIPPIVVESTETIEQDGSFSRRVTLDEHSGTHFDAPSHFLAGAAHVADVPASQLVRPLHVVDFTAQSKLDPDVELTPGDIQEHEDSARAD